MTIELHFFNIWAILVCIVSQMLIGSLWYSPLLFGDLWLKVIGKTKEDISSKEAQKAMSFSLIPAISLVLLMATVVGIENAQTISDALFLGTIVSAGFIGMSSLNLVLFEGRPFKLLLINVGYMVVSLNIAAVILTLWK